ncbi:hypothetical protein IWX49DRAFT_260129 [Phyllosticta citricarpa]|uniref:EDC4-like protein pdc1 beta-propeller domain-containing protein n=2 Tax=Phyllosticta TaxID=121621 RepID=A0ABR1LNZ8_9PEZI
MSDLQELFARLQSPSNSANSPGASTAAANPSSTLNRQPTISSPIYSPQPGGPQPHHPSAIMSPNTSAMNTPAAETGNADRTVSLLNLLKFNQASTPSPIGQDNANDRRPSSNTLPQAQAGTQERAISASDLVASFMRKPSGNASTQSPPIASPAPTKPVEAQSENPQELLLRLLNHPKPPQGGSVQSPPSIGKDVPETKVDDLAQNLANTKLESEKIGTQGSSSPDGDKPQTTAFVPKNTLFTYVNPFEQLSASSPRNRTPAPKPDNRSGANTPKVEILKHGRDTPSATGNSAPASKSRKLSATSSPSPVNEPHAPETVAEAVAEVGEKVDKQVIEAMAIIDKEAGRENAAATPLEKEELENAVRDVAADAQAQLKDRDTRREFEESMPKELAKAVEGVVEDVTQEKIADSWESAEDSPGKDEGVPVYNFPMRPFVSIEIRKLRDPPVPIRQGTIMDIARLKKEFDQIDRNLVSVSKFFIAYAMSKNGGFRLIRQDNGKYKQVFNNTKERIFNLQICTRPPGAPNQQSQASESILATGVDGTVFWAKVECQSGSDTFSDEPLETKGFIFPPVPAQDDNTSGGQLKTRAKKSSRHPEFIGIGRGKSIFIVFPNVAKHPTYADQKTRICNSEKYLEDRSFRIVTGKAGKDFAFSEDDTVIASLDKAGRLRFWDIRELIQDANDGDQPGRLPAREIRNPLLQLSTVAPGDKSWPTSVYFLDKERPCVKGTALRYLIVGLKQNHTIQLWDIGLGKPVQEINFPHENESDAICSIAYHPKTGILAVGHPTRNSIYFIHLSAPRYNLPAMSQAKYIQRLVEKDPELPKPESTAIMSGIREFSFASKGQLRSLEMLPEPAASPDSSDDATLFELYVMHSKGVTCVSIKKEDLGWSKDSKVMYPIDATANGSINLSEIRVLAASEAAPSTTESSANGESIQQSISSARTVRPVPKEVVKRDPVNRSRATSQTPETASMIATTLERVENQQDAARAAIINGDKDKKKKKKSAAPTVDSPTPIATASASKAPVPPAALGSYANVAQRAKTPPPTETQRNVDEIPAWATRLLNQAPSSGPAAAASSSVDPDLAKKIEEGVSAEFSKTFARELESLHRRLDDDRRVQEAANSANLDAVLRLVSSTLTENVEKTLSRIVTQNIQKTVIPALNDFVGPTIERRLTEILAQTVSTTVPREFKQSFPAAINMAMKDPETLRLISDLVSHKVTGQIDQHLSMNLHNLMNNITTNTAQQVSGDMERRFAEQLRQAEYQRQQDAAKIDSLTHLVTELAETVHGMSSAQANLLAELRNLQKQGGKGDAYSQSSAPGSTVGSQVVVPAQKTEEERELEEITQHMSSGQYEEGTIMWLHSPRQAQLFDDLFVRCNPAYVMNLSPLVALSVSAAVTSSLDKNVLERLMWLETVFNCINPSDPDIMDVAPKIMDVLSTRLQGAYMQIAEAEPASPALRKISHLNKRAQELKQMTG